MDGSLRGKVRAVGQEGEEDQDVEDKPFNDPFCTLVKNCNMLHNIVGPACIFLKHGFSQTLVCNRTHCGPHTSPRFNFVHLCRFIFIPASWLNPPALHHTSCVIPSLIRVRRSNLLAQHILRGVDHSFP